MCLGNLKVTCHQPSSYEIMSAALIKKTVLQASESKNGVLAPCEQILVKFQICNWILGYLQFRLCNTALDVAYRILSDSVLIFIFFFLAEVVSLLLFSNISSLPGKQGSESTLTLSLLPSQKGLNTEETRNCLILIEQLEIPKKKQQVPATLWALLLFRASCITCSPQSTLWQSYIWTPSFCTWQHWEFLSKFSSSHLQATSLYFPQKYRSITQPLARKNILTHDIFLRSPWILQEN